MPCRRLVEATVVAVSLGAGAQPSAPPVCTAPLKPALEVDLYFGRDKQDGGEVSEAEWASFLADTVTPRFPDGLSVLTVGGQARELALGGREPQAAHIAFGNAELCRVRLA